MLDAVLSVVAVVLAVGVMSVMLGFPMGVLLVLFRMDDAQIRQMRHCLDFPSPLFDGATAGKDFLTLVQVNVVASALLSAAVWSALPMLLVAGLPLAMLGPVHSYQRRKERLVRERCERRYHCEL